MCEVSEGRSHFNSVKILKQACNDNICVKEIKEVEERFRILFKIFTVSFLTSQSACLR